MVAAGQVGVGVCLWLALLAVGCGSSDAGESATGGAMNTAGVASSAGESGVVGGSASAGASPAAGSAGVTNEGGMGGTMSAGAGGSAGGSAGAGASAGAAHAGSANAGPPSTRQTAKPLGAGSSAPNGYFEYLPPGYDGSSAAPLLVFWHGVGEDGNGGTDLQKVTNHGPPELIAKDHWDNARPFIVLSPQYDSSSGEISPGSGCPSAMVIDAFFKWALTHYSVDPKRVYLTGLSCGAIGSWDYLAVFKGSLVAASVLLSGNPGPPDLAISAWGRAGCGLGDVAIWAAHGDKDPTVPYAPEHDTLTNLLACPAPPRRAAMFTDITDGGHDIWDPIYDLSGGHGDIYAWLLSNAKP
ncbi:MAG: PHB depolymerase family esterase [Polyangiaceae bacterium]